jgi:SRSO17 transposase
VGLFLAYATERGPAPLDRRLYLSKKWAADKARRAECHVPRSVKFKEKWRMALDMLDAHRRSIPHRWVLGDDEFGRTQEFRAGLRQRKEPYVLDVPCSTRVRDLQAPAPPRRSDAKGRRRLVPFGRVEQWAAAQPPARWRDVLVKDGQKGPIRVRATMTAVRTKLKQRLGPQEWLLVIRPLHPVPAEPAASYHLAWSSGPVTVEDLVAAHGRRHQIEQMFQEAKGEAGLAHYEVRSYVGWHHHMTLSLLATWFVAREQLAQGKKRRL